ncbi:MAG TPA: KTSC domain-containing protein [Methanoregula sp.]|nr:KTSC domain-containing protein [Methanoregula sp.]
MNMIWDRHVSGRIRELGYDVTTRTMAVVFSDKTTKFHAPVPYPLYASLFHATFPERLYKQVIDGKIPLVAGT